MISGSPALVGIDWGTTRLRAFQFDVTGNVQQTRESERGIATICDGGFDQILTSVLKGWPPGLPILMCGMVGSRQGWLEVPYAPCPVSLNELSQTLGVVETTAGAASIIGGLTTRTESNSAAAPKGNLLYDVMRGEETQIAGVAPAAGAVLIVTPGTHSKWTLVQDATVQTFRTYMTGELYAVLREHSILGNLMDKDAKRCEEASFMDGVRTAFEDQDFLHCIFNVRTQALFEVKTAANLASYLSGILIGSEVSMALRRHAADSALIIATPELGHLYRLAMNEAGMRSITHLDGNDAVARGLWRLWAQRGGAR